MVRRRVLGFGWGGVTATAVLAALLAVVMLGVDVRLALMQGILDLFGIDAVYWFTVRVLAAHNLAAASPIFTFITLCGVLPALHLSPRGGLWWRVAVVCTWAALCPAVWLLQVQGRYILIYTGWPHSVSAGVCSTLLSGLCLWAVTGSWVVGLVGVVAAAPGWAMLELGTPVYGGFGTIAAAAGWNLAVFVAAWWVVLRARARFARPGHCRRCGYTLAGLRTGRCPECGEITASGEAAV